MKKNNLEIIKLFLLFFIFILSSCTKDDQDEPPLVETGYSKGIFVINEGPFQNGTGTITYFSRDASEMVQKVYQKENSLTPLGNIVQSMNVEPDGEKAYITVNNANKIEIVSLKSFQHIQTIDNINSPRYLEFGRNGKVYISCWDNTVKIFSTEGYENIGQVETGTGPEKMLWDNGKLWVLNQGGFSVDSTITVINTNNDQVETTLEVYPKPTGIRMDENGKIWILCSGKGWNGFPAADDSEGHLICIDPVSYNIIKDIPFPSTTEHPEDLLINAEGNVLYYNFIDGIYSFDIHNYELEQMPFIQSQTMYYSIGLDPETNYIYAGDPVDFVQDGWVYRFNSYTSAFIDSLKVGVIPGEFYFSEM